MTADTATRQFLRTDTGTVRSRNEDNLVALPEVGLWAVCDGMGGHDAGDYASTWIVEALRALELPRRQGSRIRALRQCLQECNLHLLQHADANGLNMVGSTVVLLSLQGRRAAVVWVGDSRAYRLRGRRLRQVSRDHSMLEECIDAGQPLPGPGSDNVITRAIGASPLLDSDLLCLESQPGDCWLLCSDGVSGVLEDSEMVDVLTTAGDPASVLVDRALQAGSRDNCTALVVMVDSVPEDAGLEVAHGFD